MASFGERFVGAMQLNAQTFEEVERDTSAMGQSVTVIAIAAVAAGIGNIWYGGITGIVTGVIFALIGYLVWAGVVFLVGTKLMPDTNTKADFPEVFRVIGFAAAPGIVNLLSIIPILGWLIMFAVSLWTLAAMVVAVRQVLDYTDTVKAVIVCVIGWCAYLFVIFVLGATAFMASAIRN